jgi:hypothetical protein
MVPSISSTNGELRMERPHSPLAAGHPWVELRNGCRCGPGASADQERDARQAE